MLHAYLDPANDNNQSILIVGAAVALVMFAAAYSSHLAYKRRGGAEPPSSPGPTAGMTVGKLVVGIVVGGWILYALIVATR